MPLADDPQTRRRVRQTLIGYLHDHTCLEENKENYNGICPEDHEEEFIKLANHSKDCKENSACTVRDCWFFTLLLVHWDTCTEDDCYICDLIRNEDDEQDD